MGALSLAAAGAVYLPAQASKSAASTAILRADPIRDSKAMTLHVPAMTRFRASSAPRGCRVRIHITGGRMKVMGMRPTDEMRPLQREGQSRRVSHAGVVKRTAKEGEIGVVKAAGASTALQKGMLKPARQQGRSAAAPNGCRKEADRQQGSRAGAKAEPHMSSPKKGSKHATTVTATT